MQWDKFKKKTKKFRFSMKETSWESELLTQIPRGRIESCSSWRLNKDWTRVLVAALPKQHAPQSSAFFNPAGGQANNKGDLSIKSTAQSGLLGLSALRAAPHHADMVLWSTSTVHQLLHRTHEYRCMVVRAKQSQVAIPPFHLSSLH